MKENVAGLDLMFILTLVCVIISATPSEAEIWAMLVAGSYGYENYRHQADVCRAYQILHANGIPDERIVVMMADDIAYKWAVSWVYVTNVTHKTHIHNVYWLFSISSLIIKSNYIE